MENNKNLTAKDIIKDLAPLIKEEFVATFTDTPNGLTITFLSGQKFNVFVKEIL